MRKPAALLAGAVIALAGLAPAEGRSLVGRKLPRITYVDLRGHEILPKHYEGSVLVMFGGIPW